MNKPDKQLETISSIKSGTYRVHPRLAAIMFNTNMLSEYSDNITIDIKRHIEVVDTYVITLDMKTRLQFHIDKYEITCNTERLKFLIDKIGESENCTACVYVPPSKPNPCVSQETPKMRRSRSSRSPNVEIHSDTAGTKILNDNKMFKWDKFENGLCNGGDNEEMQSEQNKIGYKMYYGTSGEPPHEGRPYGKLPSILKTSTRGNRKY